MPLRRSVLISSTMLAVVALALPVWACGGPNTKEGNEAGGSDPGAARPVYTIDKVELTMLMTEPPQLSITASGTVRSGGWRNPRLTPVQYIRPPDDGIWDFTLVAEPPHGMATQMISPVSATYVWPAPPSDLRGVRVHSESGAVMQLIE